MSGLPLLVAAALSSQTGPMVQADPATCNARTASALTYRALLANQDRWRGRCVTVRGIWTGRVLFADMRDARRRYDEGDEQTRDRRLGVYASDALVRTRRPRPRPYQAVGILLDCAALWADDAIFVSGYCHNNLAGPLLAVTEMRPAR